MVNGIRPTGMDSERITLFDRSRDYADNATGDVYRDMDYVITCVNELADQINRASKS